MCVKGCGAYGGAVYVRGCGLNNLEVWFVICR